MLKKITALFVALALVFSISAPLIDSVDAKRYRSPSKSYQPATPNKATPQNNNNAATDGTTNRAGTTAPGTTAPKTGGGFFGGGGLMRGLMLGGLAGLMFGGLLAGLGGLGSILGMLINVLAIVAIFVLVRKAFRYFSDRNRPSRGNYR
ncbi:hypothetical protein MO973_09205 [Paenibacillus sp. TRM 82003]|nr:hypothetical protein [Paenibacillus sp. TRM 82003]